MYDSNADLDVIVSAGDTTVELSAAALDEFIDGLDRLETQTRRPRRAGPFPKSPARTSGKRDGGNGREKIELILYTSAASEKCQKALRAVHAVLECYDRSQVKFTVKDLAADGGGEVDGVIFTPTLVKRAPGPRTWIVGNLENADLLIDMLEVSGVDRRR